MFVWETFNAKSLQQCLGWEFPKFPGELPKTEMEGRSELFLGCTKHRVGNFGDLTPLVKAEPHTYSVSGIFNIINSKWRKDKTLQYRRETLWKALNAQQVWSKPSNMNRKHSEGDSMVPNAQYVCSKPIEVGFLTAITQFSKISNPIRGRFYFKKKGGN